MEYVYLGVLIFIICLSVFDLIIGVSNDAVNFLNSAVGAKTAPFKVILFLAAIGVFVGAAISNGMMDVARHGIFQPQYFTFAEIMCILLAVMVTDVILLDTFNSLGMPTSTTVSLVFELLGGTVALAMIKSIASEGQLTFAQMINTDKVLTVVLGIFLSIAIAFFFGLLVQWITRVVFTFNYKRNLKWFAGVFGGIAVTSIVYFMLFKGLKDSSFMTPENKKWITENTGTLLTYIFLGSAVLMQILHWCKVNIFKIVVLLGTFSLAMAFAGNDLVNFIGIPLTGLASYQDYMANGQALGVDGFTLDSLNGPANTPVAFLLLAGAVMVFALVTSKKAHNVIKTSVNLSKQDDGDEMFGTSKVARQLVLTFNSIGNWFTKITPAPVAKWIDTRFNKDEIIMEQGAAFDQLRAAINLVMAALLIALGTSLKLPLSTTFVTFMVAMGTSLADRAWNRESAVFRVTGVVSVIGGWFITAGAAFIISFVVALIMHYGGIIAMIALSALAIFIIINSNVKYGKKVKEEKKDDKIFSEILTTSDKERAWSLLKGHVEGNILTELAFVEETYTDFIESFIIEDRRNLSKLYRTIRNEKELFKTKRRKEVTGLKKIDKVVAVQAGTWLHIATNNTSQLIYSIRRVIEPCKDHIDNNFNPLPQECIDEIRPLGAKLVTLIEKEKTLVQSSVDISLHLKDISAYKKEVSAAMERHLNRMRDEQDSTNLNIYILYQSILQETWQMADTLKHLARAVDKLKSL